MKFSFFLIPILFLASCDSIFLRDEEQVISLDENLMIPKNMNDGLEVTSMESEHVDAAILQGIITKIYENQPNNGVRSILIARNNKLILEAYFNGWNHNRKQDLRSATKSITSSLVGIAIDQQLILNENEKVFDFFNEYDTYENWDDRKSQITIEHFLRMRTGLACNDWSASSLGNEERMYQESDWVKFILDLPMIRESGESFSYCTGAPVTLGAIITNASGQSIPDFAEINLFSHLGISDYEWEFMPDGRADTGGHLHMRPRDMLKFGLLFLNKGKWKDKQIISEDWINNSTEITGSAGNMGYGYLWWGNTWNVNGNDIETFFANGNGGQLIFVIPSLSAVIVFTGGNYQGDWFPPLLNLMNRILPAFN